MRIWTARYSCKQIAMRKELVPVSITVGQPRFKLPYVVKARIRALAPTGDLFRMNDWDEFAEHYRAKLDELGLRDIRKLLQKVSREHSGADLLLLCFENLTGGDNWCHRRVFAKWWQDQTGMVVPDLEVVVELKKLLI